ncbi:sensor domain-containing protein [Mycolicibacterium peregrinum]|uniref:Sensor domain-containing protein n=1 Tax=Mycolicibacterium peregrinum TaxID=43304 RepID=A0A4Z0HUR9_MYCPR|nr:sensor domain-containing protein [Mycolicibacterium peregrinum]TGB44685.1 sensor domain-containing protein [Mycolicibacterium peregrinum]TGB46904.1 sensor domain-containing protein [Mycolicibacterium peregrinum]
MDVKRAAIPAIAAIALAGSVLSGCGPKQTEDDAGPQVDVLGSMLASESELNTILATTDLHPKTALRQPARLDADEHASRPVCLAVIGNAMDELYRDSGYRQFRESLFADEADALEVDQAVTAFDTPTAARTLVSRTVDTWRQCAGDSLKISYDGNRRPSSFVLGNPSVVDEIDVTNEQSPFSPQQGSRRAILSVDNVVVDVRITGTNLTDGQVVQLAKAIAGRNAV